MMSTDVRDGISTEHTTSGIKSLDNAIREKKRKLGRKVCFPDDQNLVTQYFEPADPWQDVCATTRERLAEEYERSCRLHAIEPIAGVLQQIQELPECATDGSGGRAPRLCLAECSLRGARAIDALEALLRRARFHRLELHDAAMDDEGAEALFDMMEYYESAAVLNITGPRDFGIRGWQACSRLIKKSAALSELEVREAPLEAAHAPVLARSLKPVACRLRALRLQRAALAGESLLCLVTALKSNNSVRELQLGDNCLTADDAAQLAALLRANTRIQFLDLSNNQIQDMGANHIANALVDQAARTPPSAATSPLSPHHCPGASYEGRGLAVLVLWNNQLTRNSANNLSKALRSSSSLCVLNVGRNALGAKAVRALKNPGALACLGLQAARLGADAARPLADMIRARTQLQRLDLRENRLGGAGLQAILAAMRDNTTLTQIDLDDDTEWCASLRASPPGAEGPERARLVREIHALCRRNEPPEPRPHRKISLTCHTACLAKQSVQSMEEERRREKLRSPSPSPAPSPAGSPVPNHSRFSVTRVTPERDSSTDSSSPTTPTRPTIYCGTPSRFRVIQVAEPPRIQVHAAKSESASRKSTSRFSVTRNYDSVYNPEPSESKTVGSDSDTSAASGCDSSDASDRTDDATKYQDKSEELSHNAEVSRKGDDTVVVSETKLVKNSTEVSEVEKTDVKVEVTVKKERVAEDGSNNSSCNSESVNSVNNNPAKVHKDQNEPDSGAVDVGVTGDGECVNIDDDIRVGEGVESHKDYEAMKQIEAITQDLGNLIQEMKDRSTKTAALAKKASDLIKDRDDDAKDGAGVKSDGTQTDLESSADVALTIDSKIEETSVPVSLVREHNLALKKNKSESSLDSPDLEVSRFMNKREASAFCDSSSSLEISGSSMESLNASDTHQTMTVSKIVVSQPDTAPAVQSDSELDRRKPDQNALSTESSLDSNTSETTPMNSGNFFLNTSVSSNESVSPILFGKRKFHGSISSLEASVSSLESGRGENKDKVMVTSADSGIEYSLHQAMETKEDASSNEGTLTSSSNIQETPKTDPQEKTKSSGELFQNINDTLTLSPKRTSSLLDVPGLKNKGLEGTRKISWVAPSPSFHIPKPEPEPQKVELKIPSHLDKLLSLFQHPTSIFSRNQTDDERRSASNTPPRKEPILGTSFWAWSSGHTDAKTDEKSQQPMISDDRDSSPENTTDSTLSERVQVSFIDESFSKKLDSKTPSTDTDNTLSEFQSSPIQCASEASDASQQEGSDDKKVEKNAGIELKTNIIDEGSCIVNDEVAAHGGESTDYIVQKCLDLSVKEGVANDNQREARCDIVKRDLIQNPNDFNRNVYDIEGSGSGDDNQNARCEGNLNAPESRNVDKDVTNVKEDVIDIKVSSDDKSITEAVRPRSFAAVLKSTSDNSLDRQASPDTGQSIDKLPTKVIRGIKENISPENTLTSSMTNTKALTSELTDKQIKMTPGCNQQIINALWELNVPIFGSAEINEGGIVKTDENETDIVDFENENDNVTRQRADSLSIGNKTDLSDDKSDKNLSIDSGVTSFDGADDRNRDTLRNLERNDEIKAIDSIPIIGDYPENVDMGKDALSFLMFENQDFELDKVDSDIQPKPHTETGTVLAQELKDAELKEQLLDLSPELVLDEAQVMPEVFTLEAKGLKSSPVMPERSKLKKSNSLEELSQRLQEIDLGVAGQSASKPKCFRSIVFNVPEMSGSTPKDIPETRRPKLRSRSGSSPKSLPENLTKQSPTSKLEMPKKKKKVCSLGKMARDSLLALNMSEDDIAEFRRPHKLTSVESLKSLESVSEDANSQSGNSADSRCRTCLRTSQESLMSLDSISEDCRCMSEPNKAESSHPAR